MEDMTKKIKDLKSFEKKIVEDKAFYGDAMPFEVPEYTRSRTAYNGSFDTAMKLKTILTPYWRLEELHEDVRPNGEVSGYFYGELHCHRFGIISAKCKNAGRTILLLVVRAMIKEYEYNERKFNEIIN